MVISSSHDIADKTTVDFSSGDLGDLTWVAFYSDCIHEVRPVREGSRVTLTYSILVKDKEEIGSSLFRKRDERMERLLNEFEKSPIERFGVVLNHKYTFQGLSNKKLKVSTLLYSSISFPSQ